MPGRWFESVCSASLEQGDILSAFPVVQAELTAEDVEAIVAAPGEDHQLAQKAEIIEINAIVMTQSCDLENDKVDSVLLCPYWTDQDFVGDRSKREQVRRGNVHGWHLLNSDEILKLPLLFIEFSRIYTASKATASAFAGSRENRPRLVSPYREHLSQAFARFFMALVQLYEVEKG